MSHYEQFLKSSLSKYKNPDITKRDVLGVFTTYGDLRPKLEDLVFSNGTRKSLLQLDGTIPVNYKGSIYNIPVCIWLMDTHPYNPPKVYVRPTSNMGIRIGRNVDMNGHIDLPYLREWKYPNSDLVGLIQILTIVFGEEPPVYSKSQTPNSPQGYPLFEQCPYPVVSKQYPHIQPEAGTLRYPPPISANKQQKLRVPFNSKRNMPGIKSFDSSTNKVATEGLDQVSGRKSTQNTENDDCLASAEDFDIHCDPCFSENNFVEAEVFCLVCNEYFCKACLKYHRKMSATKTHKILKKDDMPRQ